MQLNIEPNNGMPIYEQLVRQIKFAVAEGVLVAGQTIPSVRDLAKSLAINPNTVQRAYLQLQAEEILQSMRGRGVSVCENARERCTVDRQSLLAERLEAVLFEVLQSGLSVERLREMFEHVLQKAIQSGDQR